MFMYDISTCIRCHMREKCITLRVFDNGYCTFLGVSFPVKYWLADNFTIELNCCVDSINFPIVKFVFRFLLTAFHANDAFPLNKVIDFSVKFTRRYSHNRVKKKCRYVSLKSSSRLSRVDNWN